MSFKQEKTKNNKVDAEFKSILDNNVQQYNAHLDNEDERLNATNERISNLIIAAGGENPNQVIDACVDTTGYVHKTLKDRLDSDFNKVDSKLKDFNTTLKSYDSKIDYLYETLQKLFDSYESNVSYYVSASTGNDKTGTGTPNSPFKTIQRAVNAIPKISASSYEIIVEKGTYLEDVKISNINNPLITISAQNLYNIADNAKDTGVYVRSIAFSGCSGYTAVRGFTLTDIANTASGISFTRCSYGVVDRCSCQVYLPELGYSAMVYDGSNGHVYGSDFSNIHTVLSALYTSSVILAYSNSGTNNTNAILSSRSIVYDIGGPMAGAKVKEAGGQIF